jgi:hypothetical protein
MALHGDVVERGNVVQPAPGTVNDVFAEKAGNDALLNS